MRKGFFSLIIIKVLTKGIVFNLLTNVGNLNNSVLLFKFEKVISTYLEQKKWVLTNIFHPVLLTTQFTSYSYETIIL